MGKNVGDDQKKVTTYFWNFKFQKIRKLASELKFNWDYTVSLQFFETVCGAKCLTNIMSGHRPRQRD